MVVQFAEGTHIDRHPVSTDAPTGGGKTHIVGDAVNGLLAH